MVHLFKDSILTNSYCSLKLRQSFFSSSTLTQFISFCQKESTPAFFKDFVIHLFDHSSTSLFPPTSHFTSTSILPSTLFKVVLSLNPFKYNIDKKVYLAVIQEHPEIIPALFTEPAKQISSTESYVNISSLEQSKSKVLINWMLEPRDSNLWGKTIDFLIEVLNLTIVLPQDLMHLATTDSVSFLTSIKAWLFPGVLTRSVFVIFLFYYRSSQKV